jgi:adenylate cyclase
MAELAPNLAGATLDNAVKSANPLTAPGASAPWLHRKLIWLEIKASCAALIVMFILAFLGLDFTVDQWLFMLAAMPVCVACYMAPDIYFIGRHFRPIGVALSCLDHGEQPTHAEASAAITRALNLPFLCFLRVNLLHGPLATTSLLIAFATLNFAVSTGFALWQMLIFATTAMLFAAPTHAIFQYFAIARDMAVPITRLSRFVDEVVLSQDRHRLVSVRLRSKLLYIAIFISGLPLVFFAISIVFKVNHMLWMSATALTADQMLPLWLWIGGVVVVCLGLALVTTMFTAAEVSRSAGTLIDAMRRVEGGQLDADLSITSTDEYADLFRGFNHMVRGLRDEARLIEVTQGLAGELNLDILIQRIMLAAAELMDAERATLFVYDARTGQLWSRYASGLTVGEIRIPSNAGIAGAVFTSGISENIPDVYADPRFDRVVDRHTGYRTRNVLCMPIINKVGTGIGVTEVLNKKGGGRFTNKDEAQLRAFTAQIAVLLENAQLFDEVLSVKNYNENILRSTSNGLITTDSEGRIVTANEASLKILKMHRDAVIGTLAAKLFAGRNDWVMDSIARVTETGDRDITLDTTLKLADGTVSVNLRAEPLVGPDHSPIGSMLVFEDITDEARVKATMRRYLSKEVADQLLASGDSVLGGKMQTVTILFSDVRNFTGLSEALGARETVSLLNEHFADMVNVVSTHGGVLDKYIGDAIMALFGVPFEKPQDADSALAVANGMLMALAALNARRAARQQVAIDIGVGIATGEVVVGNIGSPSRMEYTVIGDSVNLASRLESANKFYKTKILLDATTVRSLKNPGLLREIDLLQVKGKDHPVAVYESLGFLASVYSVDQLIYRFSEGLSSYRSRDWKTAIQCFEAALEVQPQDEPSRIYLSRCRHYQQNPPADDWTGIWVLNEK